MNRSLVKIRLKDACESIFSGGTPDTRMPEYWNGNFFWLSSGETRNRFISSTEKTITQEGIDNSSTRLSRKKDVVIASAGQGKTRGQTSFLLTDTYINQSLISLRAKKEKIDALYLFYLISSRYDALRNMSDANAIRGSLTCKMFESMELSIPGSTQEQKKVSSLLYAYDSLIENNSRRIQLLESMAKLIYDEWFVKFKFPGHEKVKMVKSDLGMIPEGWEVKSAYDIADILFGNPFKSNLFCDDASLKPIVRIRDLLDNSTSTYSPEEVDEKYEILQGDMLIGMDGIFHVCKWSNKLAYLNQRVARLRPINEKSKYFIFLSVKPKIERLNDVIMGTTVQHLSQKDFQKMRILVPPKNLMNAFKNRVDPMYENEIKLRQKNQNLSSTRDLLLPKLISGEIDVSEMDIKISGAEA